MVHVGIDVLSRQALRVAVPATSEFVTRYYMIAIAFLALPWLERQKGMIEVEVINGLLSKRADRWLAALVNVVSCVAYLGLAWLTWNEATHAFNIGSYAVSLGFRLPVWPGHFILPVGLFVAALVVGLRIFVPVRPTIVPAGLELQNER